MPIPSCALRGCVFLLPALLQACGAFEGAPDIINKSGPVSLQSRSDRPRTGEPANFELSYAAALEEQRAISSGQKTKAIDSGDAPSVFARQMAVDGISLVDANCRDFFTARGEAETVLNISRDTASASGSLASGVLSLASPANAVASAILSLVTTTTASGLDIYTKNFLFGSNNIDSVRTMTLAALAVHKKGVLPENDTTIWTFNDAVDVIMDHQNYCTPAKIRSLVISSISAGKFETVVATASTPQVGMPVIAAATAAAAGAAPTVAGTGNAAAAAVVAAGSAALSAAEGVRKGGGTPEQVTVRASEAARPLVAASVQQTLHGETADNITKVVDAISSVLGAAAGGAIPGAVQSPDRHIQVQVAR